MHDELMPSRKVAAYWVEHVLRHGGPKHPQSKDMPFYQVYLLDFWLFLFVSLVNWCSQCLHPINLGH
jgi:glucuronosyltransferase